LPTVLTLDDHEEEVNKVWELEQQEAWEIQQEQKAWQYEQEVWAIEQQQQQQQQQQAVQESEQQDIQIYKQQKKANKAKKKKLSLQDLVGFYLTGYKEPRLAILAAIKCATKNITIIMHTFTDKEIATKLAKANKVGVVVSILVDKSQSKMKQMAECLNILSNAGVKVCNQNILY
jgi:phosphatidylserine/phosphatidylglycerophosphate/cardiolipin synthase-like enzyme